MKPLQRKPVNPYLAGLICYGPTVVLTLGLWWLILKAASALAGWLL